jgi:hypothetical protein
MKYCVAAFAALLITLALVRPASAATVVPEDLFRLTFIDSSALSPDGAYVLVARRTATTEGSISSTLRRGSSFRT